ncbi:hypothetical protein [Nocardia fluminea]|uniref:Uncharacterized protein n=1 Tax=Nocardia fluminea TaxID=134984 RepID=A0A2N3WYI0_9NOCA|nr:hypothetical protein [Nocardia fluminea]PKV98931.1 hypothetical protein ATK86_0965 [Nocardia fluminea]
MTERTLTEAIAIHDYIAAVRDLRDELAVLARRTERAQHNLAAGLQLLDPPHGERVSMAISRVTALAPLARRAIGDEAEFLALHTNPEL